MSKALKAFSISMLFFSMWANAQIKKGGALQNAVPVYKNAKASPQARAKDLLLRMTPEEKVCQMCALFPGKGDMVFQSGGEFSVEYFRSNMTNGIGFISNPTVSVAARQAAEIANAIQKVAVEETRLGIPVIIIDEGLHGLMVKGACSYPQAIALAATWNDTLMKRISTTIGGEAASRDSRQLLSSVFDLGRDPRAGRLEETYGEDPYLISKMAVAYVSGVQSNQVAATGKHFVANFVGEGGRDAGSIMFSERALREEHLKPYEAAVKEAGLLSVMAAYNSLNGIPCSSNRWLLTDVLRKEWGFKGTVVSDWSGLVTLNTFHRVAASPNEAAVLGVQAGLDVDLPRLRIYKLLVEEVKAGHVSIDYINASVLRILELKFKLGLFENPYVDPDKAHLLQDAPPHRALALEAARKSMVLLKNSKEALPIHSTVKKIAVIGPNADTVQLGGYAGSGIRAITPLQGIRESFPGATVTYSKGCSIRDGNDNEFNEAIKVAAESDIVIMVMGGSWDVQGENRDRMDIRLLGRQQELIKQIAALKKQVIVVLVNGGPVIMRDWINDVNGILMAWYGGEEGGRAIGEILSGKCNPGGKLPITFPLDNGQIPIYYGNRPYGRGGSVIEIPEPDLTNRYYPQFPFGFGLSYTSFTYSNIRCSDSLIAKGKEAEVMVDIQNTGGSAGDEIVQLYLTDSYSRVSRPVKELIAFNRVNLQPGETRTLTFKVSAKNMSFLNEKLQPEIEPGEFIIMAGKNAVEGVHTTFRVK